MNTEKMNQLRNSGGFTRKPIYWGEVGAAIPVEAIKKLKQYPSTELGISTHIGATFTKTPDETLFLVNHQDGLYLVNTEGSDYARYVRYVGVSLNPPLDIVELKDEYKQKIEIIKRGDYYWWWFGDGVEFASDRINGGYKTREEAIADANAYAGAGAK